MMKSESKLMKILRSILAILASIGRWGQGSRQRQMTASETQTRTALRAGRQEATIAGGQTRPRTGTRPAGTAGVIPARVTAGGQPSAKQNADSAASVAFGPNSSEPLPRSQVLSLLRSACRVSTRQIDLIVLHCSDTRPNQDYTIEKLRRDHKARGFGAWPGYHVYIRRDGTLYYTRPVGVKGCHVKNFNARSIGICYEGGHSCSPEYKYEDNRTAEQSLVLDELLRTLLEVYPKARIVGHRDLNPNKACPCFDARHEYEYIQSL